MGEGNGERGKKRVPEVREEREEEDLAWKERLEREADSLPGVIGCDCDPPLAGSPA